MKKALSIIIGFLVLSSCGVSKETTEVVADTNLVYESVPFDIVGKGNLAGAGDEGIYESNLVIHTKADWELLISKMNAVNLEVNNFAITEVDFEKYLVIASFDKVQNSGGYSIKIMDIQDATENLIVVITKGAPTEMTASVMTQPYYIVRIPKTNKPVVFK